MKLVLTLILTAICFISPTSGCEELCNLVSGCENDVITELQQQLSEMEDRMESLELQVAKNTRKLERTLTKAEMTILESSPPQNSRHPVESLLDGVLKTNMHAGKYCYMSTADLKRGNPVLRVGINQMEVVNVRILYRQDSSKTNRERYGKNCPLVEPPRKIFKNLKES